METKTFNVEIKNFDEMKGEFEGFANTSDLDKDDDIVEPTAFTKTIKESKKRSIFYMHNTRDINQLLGMAKKMEVRDKGLFVKAQLDMDSVEGQKAARGIKAGALSEMSIGFRTIKSEIVKRGVKWIRIIKELSLHEISLIPPTMAANSRALITNFKDKENIFKYIIDNKEDTEFKKKVLSLFGIVEPDGSTTSTPEPVIPTQDKSEEPEKLDYVKILENLKEV